jgi:hypothetical protein
MPGNFFVPQFVTKPGEYYFSVGCPVTRKVIPFERDPSHGRTPFPPGLLRVSCSYCQEIHTMENPVVVSRQAQKTG